MEDKKITEQESLQIIQQMIDQTRKNVVRGKTFLWIGATLSIGSIAMGIVLWFNRTEAAMWGLCWFYVIYALAMIVCFRQKWLGFGGKEGARTYIEKTVTSVWASAWAMSVLVVLSMFQLLIDGSFDKLYIHQVFIAAFILMASLTTNFLLKEGIFSSSCFGAGIFLGLSLNFYSNEWVDAFIVSKTSVMIGIMVIFLMVIPGIKLNRWAKRLDEKNDI